MKPEQEELIEAMASALAADHGDEYQKLNIFSREYWDKDAKSLLRAAAERGYFLARLPERIGSGDVETGGGTTLSEYFAEAGAKAWNDCLDAIETVRVDE